MPNILSFVPCRKDFKSKGPREWAGPCPGCGGKDRFLVWPERSRGGAYLCRGCGAKGDGIEYLRRFCGMSYPEACAALGVTPNDSNRRSFPAWGKRNMYRNIGTCSVSSMSPLSPPQPAVFPSSRWSEAAAAFLADCQRGLETNAEALQALTDRYLTPDRANACGLGWNPADRYERRETWGLEPVKEREKILLPRGLVIAVRRKSGVVALTVRCPNDRPNKRPKYWQIAGSSCVPFVAGGRGLPVVLLESALDAALLWSETGGQCAAVAFMGSTKPLDADTTAFITAAPAIIAASDNDKAGRAAWRRWSRAFPSAVCCPAIGAKDVGDMHRAALTPPLNKEIPTVGEWFSAALSLVGVERGTQVEVVTV